VDDGRGVPVRVAHRVQGRERELGVHGRGHAGLISVYRRDLVLLFYQARRRVVKRRPLGGAVSVRGG
jgi:hypothetical protein